MSKNEYEGHWISTLYVPKFHFLKPADEEIDIRDIAHALSMTCRFGGHITRYYSVAEHCIRVALLVDERSRLSALLHDCAEAYIPDIPRPIKAMAPEFKDMYLMLEEAILSKFDAFEGNWGLIKEMDNRILLTEAKSLGVHNEDWADLGKPLRNVSGRSFGWSPEQAEKIFLERFYEYTANRERVKEAVPARA